MWKRTGEGLQAQPEGGEGRVSLGSSAGQAGGGGLLAPPSGALGIVGRQKETAPHKTEPTLQRSPGTELLLEKTAESQGRQRRTSPDPYQGEGRVWAFTTHPPYQS